MDDNKNVRAYRYSGELNDKEFGDKFDELGEAVRWLNNKGFSHNDIRDDNIMYNTKTKKLVLIDFEHANNTSRNEHNAIAEWKDVILGRPLGVKPAARPSKFDQESPVPRHTGGQQKYNR